MSRIVKTKYNVFSKRPLFLVYRRAVNIKDTEVIIRRARYSGNKKALLKPFGQWRVKYKDNAQIPYQLLS